MKFYSLGAIVLMSSLAQGVHADVQTDPQANVQTEIQAEALDAQTLQTELANPEALVDANALDQAVEAQPEDMQIMRGHGGGGNGWHGGGGNGWHGGGNGWHGGGWNHGGNGWHGGNNGWHGGGVWHGGIWNPWYPTYPVYPAPVYRPARVLSCFAVSRFNVTYVARDNYGASAYQVQSSALNFCTRSSGTTCRATGCRYN